MTPRDRPHHPRCQSASVTQNAQFWRESPRCANWIVHVREFHGMVIWETCSDTRAIRGWSGHWPPSLRAPRHFGTPLWRHNHSDSGIRIGWPLGQVGDHLLPNGADSRSRIWRASQNGHGTPGRRVWPIFSHSVTVCQQLAGDDESSGPGRRTIFAQAL